MIELSTDTEAVLRKLIPDEADRQIVADKLRNECTGIWREEDGTPESLERIRFGVLKLLVESPPEQDISHWIGLVNRDWRDILMWAGFGNDIQEHERWKELTLTSA